MDFGQRRGEIVRMAVQLEDEVAILALSGKFLAGSDGPFLRQKLKDLVDAGTRKFIIDFEDVPYIDSTGLGFLAGARVTVQNAGARMVLAGMNVHVRRIMEDVKLTQFFVLAGNQAEAMALLNQPQSIAEPTAESDTSHPKRKRRAGPAAEA
jgi:anti-anti-sigma factor